MQRDDFTIIKQQIAEEILKENDDVDGCYYHYRDPLSVTLTIGDGILNPPLSEDLLRLTATDFRCGWINNGGDPQLFGSFILFSAPICMLLLLY